MSWILHALPLVWAVMFSVNNCRRVHLTGQQINSPNHQNEEPAAAFSRLLQSFNTPAAWQSGVLQGHTTGHPSLHETQRVRDTLSGVQLAEGVKNPKQKTLTDEEKKAFIEEIESKYEYDLRMIATHEGQDAGVNWEKNELTDVHIKNVDEEGMVFEEGICEMAEGRCIAVDVPIPWPKGMSISKLPEMRKAFTALSRKAFFAVGGENVVGSEFESQQAELYSLMSLINSEFVDFLKYYVFHKMDDVLENITDIARVQLTQLNYEGFTVEIDSTEYKVRGTSLTDRVMVKSSWAVSRQFDKPCASPEEVEQLLMAMLEIEGDSEE